MENMILSPEEYAARTPRDLLEAAARGHVGIDQRWLRALVSRPGETAAAIAGFASGNREEDREQLTGDLIALVRQLRRPEALPFLLAQAEKYPEDIDYELVAAFRELGAAAVEPLLELCGRAEKESRPEFLFLLASLGVRDGRIRQLLIDYLAEDAVEAGHCLASYGDPSAAEAIRGAAAQAAEAWQRTSLEASAALLEAGGAKADEEEPFDLFAEYPEEADPRFDLLDEAEIEAFLASPEPDYRAIAIDELTHEGVPDRLTARLRQLAERDPSPEVRGRAWENLGEVARRDASLREVMTARLRGEQYPLEERCGVLVALATIEREKKAFRETILRFYEMPEARVKAMQAMILAAHEDFIPYFTRHLEDADEVVRIQAIQGVGFYELSEEADRLIPAFEIDGLREEALPCYALAAAAEMNRRGMRQLYERIEQLAGGLSEDEEMAVKDAINLRLNRYDLDPLFGEDGALLAPAAVVSDKPGRNDPCPCGSGKKYKKCCGR
jgi:uncharacterized protein YecA (UPF0149 family)